MKKIIILQFLSIFIFTNLLAAVANCNGGNCKFDFSNHYKSAQTNCFQIINYEEVETNYLYFTIVKTNEKCEVFNTVNSD